MLQRSDVEQRLVELPGAPRVWICAFTCPTPECGCRTAIVLATPGDREALLERGRPVAEAWLGDRSYARAAQDLPGVTAFAVDLDARTLPRILDTSRSMVRMLRCIPSTSVTERASASSGLRTASAMPTAANASAGAEQRAGRVDEVVRTLAEHRSGAYA